MQRRVLLGAGAAVLVLVGAVALRATLRRQAGQAVDTTVNQFVASLPPGYALRHGTTDYNPLTSALTVRDVVLTRDGAPAGSADVVTLSGADQRALRDVLDPAAYPGGHPAWTDRRLLIADASASNVHIMTARAGQMETVLKTVTVHRLSGHPFDLPPTPDNRGRPDFLAGVALILAADSVHVHGLSAHPSASDPGRVDIGDVTLGNYDGGRIGAFSVRDVALQGEDKPHGRAFSLTADTFAFTQADTRAALETVRRTGHADRGQLSGTMFANGSCEDVHFDVGAGPRITLHDMQVSGTPATSGDPATGKLSLHGLTIALGDTPVPPNAAPALGAFGLTAITLDVDADSHSDPAAKRVSLREDFRLHDLGRLHLEVVASGYDAALASQAQPLAGLLAATPEAGTLNWQDDGLTNRLLAVGAAQTHSTPDLVRAQLAMPVVTLGMMLPDQPDAADQVTAFLQHPHSLTITMKPPQTVTLAQIAQTPLPSRAHILGLHISGN